MAEPAESAERRVDQIVETITSKGDFPVVARVIQRLHEVVPKENCNALEVARVILADPGLSSKVLRVVNSSYYRPRGEPISTITRAVMLLGFEAIRDLTTGLVLLDELARAAGGRPVVREVLHQALVCGSVARALSTTVGYPQPEEAYLLGLFANLGQLCLAAYYHDEYERAVSLADPRYHPLERALHEVFGIASADLATGILMRWNFPAGFGEYFRSTHPSGDRPVLGHAERLFAIVDLAHDYAVHESDAERDPEVLAAATRRYEAMFQRRGDELLAAIERGLEDVHDALPALRIAAAHGEHRSSAGHATPRPTAGPSSGAGPRAGDAAAPRPEIVPDGAATAAAFEILAEISRGILAQDDINDTLAMVLEGIARTGRFDVAFLALLNPRKDRLIGRLGFGDGVDEYLKGLSLSVAPNGGVLVDAILAREPRSVAQGAAAMLVPPGAPAPKIPAASFVVQPLVVRGKAIGVLAATRGAGMAVGAADLTLVQLFCNHAGLALDRAVA